MVLASLFLLLSPPTTPAASLRLTAYSKDGRPLNRAELLSYISPVSAQGQAPRGAAGLFVTDMDGNPAEGRPWWNLASSSPLVRWSGARRVQLSLPWPVADDGFSTVLLDKGGAGYADGDAVLLNEEVAATQHRLFPESLNERRKSWEPRYVPSDKALKLQKKAAEAMAAAYAEGGPRERARLFEKALTAVSLAWAKMLFEHGTQTAAHPKLGPGLRWGLTLDETFLDRLQDYDRIMDRLKGSGADWVRLVFRLNPNDFAYENLRSFNEYDRVLQDLDSRGIRVMGSVLDSALWPRTVTPAAMTRRTSNLVLHYRDRIRTWEVASEPNGNWLGGWRKPLPDAVVRACFSASAAEVKRIDPSVETVATLYWWEGTAGDDSHPTFAWLRNSIPAGDFKNVDIVALSIYPDEHPMGMAFDPAFRRLARYFPGKRLMLGGFGYVEGQDLQGYWWLDPKDVDGARKDLLILYTGSACAIPRSLGGGFWWFALNQMLGKGGDLDSLYRLYRRTLHQLGR